MVVVQLNPGPRRRKATTATATATTAKPPAKPVQTRSKKVVEPEEVEEDSDEASDLDALTSSESESSDDESGSEYEGRRTRGKQPAKKAKTSTTTPAKRGKGKKTSTTTRNSGRRAARSSKSLCSLSADTLREVMSKLSPKDLLSLYKVNKMLHGLLRGSQAVAVWKSARSAEDVPDPTPGISEAGWAMLIFGGSRCECCDAPNVLKVDFGLRRRVCVACKKKNLVVTSKFKAACPDLNEEVLDFLPYSNAGGWSHGHASNSKFYWKPDIERVAKVWNALKDDVDVGKPGAEDKLDAFETTRIQLVRKIIRNVDDNADWYSGMRGDRANPAKSRKEEIIRRFCDMGYPQKLVAAACNGKPEFEQKRELTERIWTRIMPILEPLVKEHTRSSTLHDRKRLIAPLFKSYLKGLAPNEWTVYPRLGDLFSRPEFECVLDHSLTDAEASSVYTSKVAPLLPGIAKSWISHKRETIWEMAEDALKSSTVMASVDKVLDLAISTFICKEGFCSGKYTSSESVYYGGPMKPFFGWEEAKFHVYHPLVFSKTAHNAVNTLMIIARMDPATTTPAQIDDKGHLFFCEACTLPKRGTPREIFTWRQAVAHDLSTRHSDTGHESLTRTSVATPTPTPLWKLLTPEQRTSVTLAPPPRFYHTLPKDTGWSCNHCNAHFPDFALREDVESHLKRQHQILQPKTTEDLIHCPGGDGHEPRRVYVDPNPPPPKPNSLYVCKQCPEKPGKPPRQFIEGGVKCHLQARHRIPKPIEGEHYEQAEAPVK